MSTSNERKGEDTGNGSQKNDSSHSPSKRRRSRREEAVRRSDKRRPPSGPTDDDDDGENRTNSVEIANIGSNRTELPRSRAVTADVENTDSGEECHRQAGGHGMNGRRKLRKKHARKSKTAGQEMLVGDATTERSESDRCCATDSPHGDTDSPHDEGGGDAGWGAANREVVGAIGKLLLMIPVDIEKLRNMAWERGGYQADEVRIKVWPKLLGLDRHGLEDFRQYLEIPHPMAEQIQRDIDRSLTHFTHVRRWKRQRTQSKRDMLRDVINAVVSKYDRVLNYYQGYHDVVATLLLVTGDCQLTFALTERVSHYFLRDSMRDDFAVLTYLLHLVPAITYVFDRELDDFISKSKVEPYYCMAWVLTWFAHDLKDLHSVARIYDVLLGAHPTLILYVSAAVVISARGAVLECDCDFASVHKALSHSAKRVQDWEAVLRKAKGMFLKCPPRELVVQAPAYIKDVLGAGGVTALEFPPPWFTGTSLPDWILLEQRREKKGKRRIGEAAEQWRKAARLAGAENPQEMLLAYTNVKGDRLQTAGGTGNLLGKILSQLRLPSRKWKIVPSPAAVLSAAVLVGALSYTYTLRYSTGYSGWAPPQ